MAKTWDGLESWRITKQGKPYAELERAIGGNTLVDVYVDMDPEAYIEGIPRNSFKKETLTKMKYSEFLTKSGLSANSLGMAMKDESDAIYKALR